MTRSAAAEVANSLQHVQSASGEIGDVETVSHRQQIVDLHIDGVELQEVVRPRNPVTPPTGVEGAVPRGAGPPTMAAPAALQTGGAPHADTPSATNAAARPPRGSARARPATVRVPPGGTAGGMQERGDRVTRREASPARGSMPLRPTPVRPPPARPSIARTSGFPTPSDIIRTFNRYTPSNRPVSASPGGGLTARAGSTPYARPSSERFRSNDFHRLVGSAFGVSLGTPLSGAPTAGNAGLFNSPARPPSNSKRHSTGMASFRRRAASASGGRLNDLRKNRRSVDFGRPGALQSLNEMHATNRWREADRAEAMATSARKILEGLSRTREENRMLAQKLKEEGSSPIGPPPSSLKRSREAGGFGGEGGKRARRSVRDSGVLIPSAFNPNPPGAGSQARPRPPETMVEAGKARSNKRKSMSFVEEEEGAENVLERVAARKRRSVSYSAASNLGSAFKAYALAQSQKDVARKSGFEPSAGKSEGKERGEDARSVVRRRIEAHESGVGTRTAFGTAGASAFNKATEVAKAVSTFKPSAGDGQRKKLNPILNKSPNDGTPKAHKAVTFADGGAKRKVSFGEVEEKDEVTPAPAFKFNIPSPLVKKTSDEVVKATAAKPLSSMPKSGEVEKKEAEKESAADKFTFGTPVGFNSANIEPAVVGPTPAIVETAAAPTAMEAPVVSAPAASVPAPAPAVASLGGFEAARKPAAVKETAAPTADLFGAKPGGEAAKTLLSFVQPAEAPKETEEVKKPAAPAPFSFGDAVKPGDSATGVFAFPAATKPAASAPEEVKASESKETTEPAPTPAVAPTTLPVTAAEPPKPAASEPAPAASLPVPKAALPSPAKSGFGAPTTSVPEGVFSFKTQSAPAAAAAAPSKPSEPTPFASAPPGFGAPAFGQPAESASAPAASNPFGSSAPAFGAGSGPKPSGNPFGESTSFNPSATVQGFQFGSAPAATGSGGPFGATPSAPSASAPALAGSGGGFGGQSTPFGDGGGFSGGNAFVFGGSQPAPAAPAAPFSSGAGSAPAFGFGGASAAGSAPFGGASAPATAPTPFGSSAATPFGSAPTFGSASGPAGFGGGSAPQFGPPASTPFGGPAQSAPAPFGGPAQSASQPFGAPAPSASAPFGAFGGGQSAPQFGAPAQGAQSQAAQTLFGGAPPAGSGFSMGANGNQTGSKPRRVLKCRRSKRG